MSLKIVTELCIKDPHVITNCFFFLIDRWLCQKGTITGGEKDEIPPKFVKAIPPNYSTNFNRNEIRIYFDEYVKTKGPTKTNHHIPSYGS